METKTNRRGRQFLSVVNGVKTFKPSAKEILFGYKYKVYARRNAEMGVVTSDRLFSSMRDLRNWTKSLDDVSRKNFLTA